MSHTRHVSPVRYSTATRQRNVIYSPAKTTYVFTRILSSWHLYSVFEFICIPLCFIFIFLSLSCKSRSVQNQDQQHSALCCSPCPSNILLPFQGTSPALDPLFEHPTTNSTLQDGICLQLHCSFQINRFKITILHSHSFFIHQYFSLKSSRMIFVQHWPIASFRVVHITKILHQR